MGVCYTVGVMPLVVNAHLYRDPARAFVETVLVEAGFSHLPPDEKAEAVAALTIEAQKRVGLDLMTALDMPSLTVFERLMESGADEAEIEAFFRVRVPDLDVRVRDALSAFGAECLESARRLESVA